MLARQGEFMCRIRRQQSRLLERQVDVLEMIARDAPLDDVLEKICRIAEAFAPGSMAGVTVLDRGGMTFEHCVMPSAPSFAAGIPGVEVGPPHAGTCAAAVFGGAPVSSSDVENDERFDPLWRRLNTDHGVSRHPLAARLFGRRSRARQLLHRLQGRRARSVARGDRGDRRPALGPRARQASGDGAPEADRRRDAASAEEPVRRGAVDRRADVTRRRHDRGIPESLRRPRSRARQRP